MKSVLILVLHFLLVLPTYAQQISRQAAAKAELDDRIARIDRRIGQLGMASADISAALLRQRSSQSWDGSQWVDDSRTTFTYSGELVTEELTEMWDGDSWEPSDRTIYAYSDGRLTSITSESFEGGTWSGDIRTLFSYSGDRISETIDQTFENGVWVNAERTTVTETNGEATGGLTESWTGTAWEASDRYTVRQEGDDVVLESQEWNGSAWENTDRTVYLGLTIEELYDFFEQFTLESDLFSMGFSGLMSFPDFVEQQWDGSQWVNLTRQMSDRDTAGRPLMTTYEDWDGSAWEGSSRLVASYDGEGRFTTIDFQQFSETWMSFLTEVFSYDNDGLLSEILTQIDFGAGIQNSSRLLFDWTGEGTAIVGEGIPGSFLLEPLYPNPFNPQTTVKYRLDSASHAHIRIFDALGRHVETLIDGAHAAGEYEIRFEAAGLPSGTYLVRLVTPAGIQTRTVTLLR